MEGKKLLLIVTLFSITHFIESHPDTKVFISGGIIFERANESPVNINPPKITFTRYLNTDTIQQGINQTIQFTSAYSTFCENLNKKVAEDDEIIKTNRFFLIEKMVPLSTAESECSHFQGKLPEIKTKAEMDELYSIASKNKIEWIPAGMTTSPELGNFIFITDRKFITNGQSIYQKVYRSNLPDNQVPCHLPSWKCTKSSSPEDTYAYKIGDNNFKLYELNKVNSTAQAVRSKIICQSLRISNKEGNQHNLLLKMAAHTCIRDIIGLRGVTSVIIDEGKRFTRMKREITDKPIDHFKERVWNTLIQSNKSSFPSPRIICFNSRIRRESCNRYIDFVNTLSNFSTNISKNFQTSDSIISLFLLHNIFQSFDLLPTHNNTIFYGCSPFNEILSINIIKLEFSQDIQMIHLFSREIISNCNKWPHNFLSENSKEIYKSKDFILESKEFLAIFQNFNFTANNNTTLNLTNTNYIQTYAHKRQKRLAHMLPMLGGLAGTNTIYSLGNGGAPFSWFGSFISKTTGLVHREDIETILKLMSNNTHMIEDINLNQEQLVNAYNDIGEEIGRLNNMNSKFEYSTATLLQEIDHKTSLRVLQDTIQITLLKIANALSYSLNHIASPYMLSQDELTDIANKYRERNIHLSNNMKDVTTDVFLIENKILFQFTIPVLEDKNLFKIFKASSVPVFLENAIIRALIDTPYIAFSAANNEYSILTQEEFLHCKNSKYCTAVDIIRPIGDGGSCVVQTLDSGSQSCDFVNINKADPFYKLYDHMLVYSVKGPNEVKFKCKTSMGHTATKKQLRGIGAIEVASDCQIIFSDNYKAFTAPDINSHDLGEAKFMDVFHFMPTENQYHIPDIKYNGREFKKLNLTKTNTKAVLDFIDKVLNPEEAVPEITRALIGIAIFLLIVLIACKCSPCFALWLKTCTGCKNPTEWYTKVKHYDGPSFYKLAPSEFSLSRLKNSFKDMFGYSGQERPNAHRPEATAASSHESHGHSFDRSDYRHYEENLKTFPKIYKHRRLNERKYNTSFHKRHEQLGETILRNIKENNDFVNRQGPPKFLTPQDKFTLTQPHILSQTPTPTYAFTSPHMFAQAPPENEVFYDYEKRPDTPIYPNLKDYDLQKYHTLTPTSRDPKEPKPLKRNHSSDSLKSIIINRDQKEIYISPRKSYQF